MSATNLQALVRAAAKGELLSQPKAKSRSVAAR